MEKMSFESGVEVRRSNGWWQYWCTDTDGGLQIAEWRVFSADNCQLMELCRLHAEDSPGNIARERVQTRVTNLELSTTPPVTNGCRNDDMIQLGSLRSQSLFQFVQTSDEYFEHFLLLHSPHSVINWIQTWRIWRPQLRWNKFKSFFI